MILRRTKVIFGLTIGSLLALFLILLAIGLLSAPRGATLSLGFAGYYTNASGAVLAQVTVSNNNPWEILHRVGEPQLRSKGAWPQPQITEGQAYEIPSGQTSNLLIRLPEGSGRWRVPVVYCRPISGVEWKLRRGLGRVAPLVGRQGPSTGLLMQTNFTPEISR